MSGFIEFKGELTEVHRSGQTIRSDTSRLETVEKVVAMSRIQAITKRCGDRSFSLSINGGAGEQNASYIFTIDEPTYYRLKEIMLSSESIKAEEKEEITVKNPIAGLEVNEAP